MAAANGNVHCKRSSISAAKPTNTATKRTDIAPKTNDPSRKTSVRIGASVFADPKRVRPQITPWKTSGSEVSIRCVEVAGNDVTIQMPCISSLSIWRTPQNKPFRYSNIIPAVRSTAKR